MKKLLYAGAGILARRLGKSRARKLIRKIAWLSEVDLWNMVLSDVGVNKYENADVSGENFVLQDYLRGILNRPDCVLFDVGANRGEYSLRLREVFPKAVIHAFEPNPKVFEKLSANTAAAAIQCHNLALGSEPGHITMHIPVSDDENRSEHGSVFKDVLTSLHHYSLADAVEVEQQSIEQFCQQNNIPRIDFLKVDTEGYELAVLKGAADMARQGKIGPIQFEFNEMNVISRVFLRDFYQLLDQHTMYRIDSHRLIPLGSYHTVNEIFLFQNILAVPSKQAD